MASSNKNKRRKALDHLESALDQYDNDDSELNFITVTKAFEIAIEYSWRALKDLVENDGLDAASPKMAVRQAARLELITDPETWLDCIDARNGSVHDYYSISQEQFLKLVRTFLTLAQPD